MKKVLKVDMVNGVVLVGDVARETFREYSLDDFTFIPNNGDYVRIYVNDQKTIIEKYEEEVPVRSYAGEEILYDERHKVNKIVYIVLAVFTGVFGIHHFYAGDTSRGMKYLLCGLFLSWTVIVPFVLIFKSISSAFRVLMIPGDVDGNVMI